MRAGKRNKVEENLIELAIAHNPHIKEPKKLADDLRRIVEGLSDRQEEEFDKEGLKRLKQKMRIDKLKYRRI